MNHLKRSPDDKLLNASIYGIAPYSLLQNGRANVQIFSYYRHLMYADVKAGENFNGLSPFLTEFVSAAV